MAATTRPSGVTVSKTGPVQLGKGTAKRSVHARVAVAPGNAAHHDRL